MKQEHYFYTMKINLILIFISLTTAIVAQNNPELKGHTSYISRAYWSSENQRIITFSHDKTVKIWDANSGKQVANINAELDGAYHLMAFSSDIGNKIFVYYKKDSANLYRQLDGSKLVSTRLNFKNSSVKWAEFNATGTMLVCAVKDGKAFVFDAETGKQICKLHGSDFGYHYYFSPDGAKLVTLYYNPKNTAYDMKNEYKIWDTKTGKSLGKLDTKFYFDMTNIHFEAPVFSPDSKRILTFTGSNTPKVFDIMSGKLVGELQGNTNIVNSAEYSKDGKRILTTCSDNIARLWDAETFQLMFQFKNVINASYSDDGSAMVTLSDDSLVRIWNSATCTPIKEIEVHNYKQAIFCLNKQGNRLLIAWQNETKAELWNTETLERIATIDNNKEYVNSPKFSSDGNKILIISDQTCTVWDANSGTQLFDLK